MSEAAGILRTAFRPVSSLTICPQRSQIERGMETSKDHRIRDFFPHLRPSYLSIFLLFISGILFLRNDATNDRLFALEQKIISLTKECIAPEMKAARSGQMVVTLGFKKNKRRGMTPPQSRLSSSG